MEEKPQLIIDNIIIFAAVQDNTIPGSSFSSDANANTPADLAAKVRDDPLFLIRKKEEEKKKELINNPIKMKQLRQMLQDNLTKSKKKKDKKKKKKERKEKKRRETESEDSDTDDNDARMSDRKDKRHHRYVSSCLTVCNKKNACIGCLILNTSWRLVYKVLEGIPNHTICES